MRKSKKIKAAIDRLNEISPDLIKSWEKNHELPKSIAQMAKAFGREHMNWLAGFIQGLTVILMVFCLVTAFVFQGVWYLPDYFRAGEFGNSRLVTEYGGFISMAAFLCTVPLLFLVLHWDGRSTEALSYCQHLDHFMDAAERLLDGFHMAGPGQAKDELSNFRGHVDRRLVSLVKAFLLAEKECRDACRRRPVPNLKEVQEKVIAALLAKKSFDMHFQATTDFGLEPSKEYIFSWAQAELARPVGVH